MLAQQFRLPPTVSFSHGSIFHSDFFTLRVVHSPLPYSRYGFLVSKKIDKRAVVRNSTKRKVRSCIEEKWLATLGYDMLFLIKKESVEAKREDICKKIDDIMAQLTKS